MAIKMEKLHINCLRTICGFLSVSDLVKFALCNKGLSKLLEDEQCWFILCSKHYKTSFPVGWKWFYLCKELQKKYLEIKEEFSMAEVELRNLGKYKCEQCFCWEDVDDMVMCNSCINDICEDCRIFCEKCNVYSCDNCSMNNVCTECHEIVN